MVTVALDTERPVSWASLADKDDDDEEEEELAPLTLLTTKSLVLMA